MKNNSLLTIALLAGLALASSCHSSSEVIQTIDDRPHVQFTDSIENRADIPSPGSEEYSPRTLIISYDTEVGTAALDTAIEDLGAEVIYRYRIINALAIRIPDGKDIHDAIRYFESMEGVIAVNRDRIHHLHD